MERKQSHLDGLFLEPHETLDVEFKEWLDLTDNNHRAVVAKEIIALANHGGGYLVIGFEEATDGSLEPAKIRPPNLDAWSPDGIQSIVAKYIDPTVQCRVFHLTANGGSGNSYPIIAVPSGHRVPVRAKSGSPDGKLAPHRIYVRRPGPASEEPKTAEEWDRLFERILQNRKAELLEAMRAIMAGTIPSAQQPSTSSRFSELTQFEKAAVARWEDRTKTIPAHEAPRFWYGYYDVGIAIDGEFVSPSLADLRQTIKTAVRNHSGWPPFLTLDRVPFTPKPLDGAVEFWRGPDNDGSFDTPVHHDFWRISPAGLFFTRMGYGEDSRTDVQKFPPGKAFSITGPTWRIGEAILEVAYIARALKTVNANLIVHCRWNGLKGRRLTARGTNRILFDDRYAAEQNSLETTQTVALDAIPQSLPEVVYALLAPLYELFDFYELPKRLVEEELAALQKNQFS